MGKLYIIATPIGNMGDITLRALETLKSVDLILAEDTRTTVGLLRHYNISQKEIVSFFEGNEEQRQGWVIRRLLADKNVGLVSESGTPLISDPGYKLVRECTRLGIPVETLPGPTAFVAALTLSGLPPNAFFFLGYLSKKNSRAKMWLEQIHKCISEESPVKTVILYESPHRLLTTLQLIKEIFGEIDVVVARELTKFYEEVKSEKVSDAIVHFSKVRPRGEIVVLF